jgi:hypothetical protein
MTKELVASQEKFELLEDIDQLQMAVRKLLQTKHYQALGEAGMFAVLQKAKSLKIDPVDALGGALYCLNGKVGMSAELMNTLIRSKGHSITKDAKSNDTICILHGKRVDNGDTWTESFSIDDAKRAGIYKDHSPWGKYPRNMCFNRALSNLARQLFPDVIKGCYEIEELRSFAAPMIEVPVEQVMLSQEEMLAYMESFGEEKERFGQYVEYVSVKQKWDIPTTVTELKKMGEKTVEKFKKWSQKNVPATIIEAPIVEEVK